MQVLSNGRVRRTAAEWREIFARFDRSELSVDVFCERESVNKTSFRRWRSRLASATGRFVELGVARPSGSSSSWEVELELPEHIVLRVRG